MLALTLVSTEAAYMRQPMAPPEGSALHADGDWATSARKDAKVEESGEHTHFSEPAAISEEIALAQFNRLVSEELARGCLRPGPRRNKRWARHTRRGFRMRDNRKATKWRAYKRKSAKLMTWVRTAAKTRALTRAFSCVCALR